MSITSQDGQVRHARVTIIVRIWTTSRTLWIYVNKLTYVQFNRLETLSSYPAPPPPLSNSVARGPVKKWLKIILSTDSVQHNEPADNEEVGLPGELPPKEVQDALFNGFLYDLLPERTIPLTRATPAP